MSDLAVDLPAIEETPVVMVTPEMAQAWLSRAQFDAQRAIRPSRVAQFVSEIEAGQFRRSVLSLRKIDGEYRVIDGYHRLNALLRTGRTLPFDVLLHSVTAEDAAKDYAVLDRPLVRGHVDNLAAFRFFERLGLSRQTQKFMQAAAPLVVAGFRSGLINGAAQSTQDRGAFIEAWAREGAAAVDAIGSSHTRLLSVKLRNAGSAAVMLVTFRYQPSKAEAFWSRLAANNGLFIGDPGKALIDYLFDSRSRGRNHAYLARAVAVAWNAEFSGRSINFVKVVREIAQPILIAGTPYDGKRHIPGSELPPRSIES